jgi:hypothetical protein
MNFIGGEILFKKVLRIIFSILGLVFGYIISEVILINKTGSRGEVKAFFIKQIIAVVTVSIMTLIQLFVIKLLFNKLILI